MRPFLAVVVLILALLIVLVLLIRLDQHENALSFCNAWGYENYVRYSEGLICTEKSE